MDSIWVPSLVSDSQRSLGCHKTTPSQYQGQAHNVGRCSIVLTDTCVDSQGSRIMQASWFPILILHAEHDRISNPVIKLPMLDPNHGVPQSRTPEDAEKSIWNAFIATPTTAVIFCFLSFSFHMQILQRIPVARVRVNGMFEGQEL